VGNMRELDPEVTWCNVPPPERLKSKMNQRTQFELQVVAFGGLPKAGCVTFATFENSGSEKATEWTTLRLPDFVLARFPSHIKRVADRKVGIPGAECGTRVDSAECGADVFVIGGLATGELAMPGVGLGFE
jgi:hypothetical protein